ncbi:DUF6268 family outer membrane beta-barrel protein [Lutibacter sp.]|uniref:DUF6268 family outer membrane beta-barrel protein n=1 Tax=Lutibacter sp. TaxID=1925666 RepID=UPI0025B8F140|nr:DUF6268 family outer membrane beta-barrel protein [Lutibacter sp.]MCF6181709.1 DUF6268 family outer membrane beta-barrel protein [Lutibacter sp.]
MDLRLGVFLLMFISIVGKAQNFEIFSGNIYSTLNNSNSVGLKNAIIKINLPLHLKKGGLINRLFFSKYNLDYNSEETLNTSNIESFKILKYSLEYYTPINNTWSLKTNFSPIISSNFEANITMDDVFFNGSLVFVKSNKKSIFQVGVVYNISFGTKKPIPIINYSRKINNNASYVLGMPITKIEYSFNSINKANIYLKPKGFYSNISNNIVLNNNEIAETVKYQSIQSGISYSHSIDEFLKLSLDMGYQFSSKYELLNNNKSIYKFKMENSFFVGLNLKFNLLKNKKN